ncbi:LysR family transcriptional regulator [Roseomonas sp. M0104]|uniref:LysR family transcriptional regulator n=1 Tax=Teichococcus coralli TaxID=2545983 RepID=A0A845BCC1_9PROT|nr:LysR family transcriptional regulator [Pseudoroseomonas coralli]MXP64338.1 LysR family transcriptional regulator [Pseudoroseomonas coralli]
MRPDIEALATFVQVVDSGTITAAAARLGLAKSVVSKRVAVLETQLSARLLHRAPRRVTPTEAGSLLYERARALLGQLDTVADEVMARSGALQGMIRLAAPLSFGIRYLGPLIADFMRRYEGIEVVLDLDDRHVDLFSGGYDLALRSGRLGDSELRTRRLGTSNRALCCSPDYAARHGPPPSLEALAAHSCLGYANAAAGHIWRFAPVGGGEPRSLVLRGRMVANSGEALLDAARAGIGLVVLPTFLVAEAVRAGDLIPLRIPGWEPVPDTIQLVYPPTPAMPLKVRALIEHLAGAIREPFAWDEPFERFLKPGGSVGGE